MFANWEKKNKKVAMSHCNIIIDSFVIGNDKRIHSFSLPYFN